MLENPITQIACNLSPPAMTKAPVWPPLPHFHISLQIQCIHRQMHTRLLFFCLQIAHSEPRHFHFQSNQKVLSPHCPWGNFSLFTPLITFIMHRLHTVLLYSQKMQAPPYRHAQWTCNLINPCSKYKDKGTRYTRWASATTHIPVPSSPCRKTLPAECSPITKTPLQHRVSIWFWQIPFPIASLPFLSLLIQEPWTSPLSLLHTNWQSLLLHIHCTLAGFTVIPFCWILIALLAKARQ